MRPVRLVNGQLYAPPGCCGAPLRGWSEIPVEMKVATVAGIGLVAVLGALAVAGSTRRTRR